MELEWAREGIRQKQKAFEKLYVAEKKIARK